MADELLKRMPTVERIGEGNQLIYFLAFSLALTCMFNRLGYVRNCTSYFTFTIATLPH